MSAILAVLGARVDDDILARMADAMTVRGDERRASWRGDGVALGVARFAWEQDDDFAGGAMIGRRGELWAVADASVYYRDALRRRLAAAGVDVVGPTATDLVLAAYEAWGADGALALEGDFAFVLWDAAHRRALAARDFSGKRTLYWSRVGDGIVVASMLAGVCAHPDVSSEVDVPTIAALAAGLWVESAATSYRHVSMLQGGRTLLWSGAAPRIQRFWHVPEVETATPGRMDEAAEALRALLADATAERLARRGTTSIWMSGGWDSTAVYGAGQGWLRREGDARRLHPVSISYPVGDPGREDELIRETVDAWDGQVRWVDIAGIPMFDRTAERAAHRDDALAHLYENWNRALARGTRSLGARVAFDGNGGDQMHQVSPIYLADLLRGGRLVSLAREARAIGALTRESLLRWAIVPALPALVRGAVEIARGRPMRRHMHRALVPWVRRDFARRHQLLEREFERWPVPARGSLAAREVRLYLSATAFQRSFGVVTGLALEEGVELRSPLYDRRVVEFMATRPREERASGRETKLLLRRAGRGLLPERLLAPRAERTGVTTGYSDRSVRAPDAVAMFRDAFRAPILEELGAVDGAVLRGAFEHYITTGRTRLRAELVMTLQAELWLRSRLRPSTPPAAVARVAALAHAHGSHA